MPTLRRFTIAFATTMLAAPAAAQEGVGMRLESAGFVISRLERRPEIEKTLLSTFRRMLQRYRSAVDGGSEAKPADPA